MSLRGLPIPPRDVTAANSPFLSRVYDDSQPALVDHLAYGLLDLFIVLDVGLPHDSPTSGSVPASKDPNP